MELVLLPPIKRHRINAEQFMADVRVDLTQAFG
jgi:hypothetical protein